MASGCIVGTCYVCEGQVYEDEVGWSGDLMRHITCKSASEVRRENAVLRAEIENLRKQLSERKTGSVEDTIGLLLQAMDKRRQYLRRKLRRLEAKGTRLAPGRPNESNRLKYSGRGGMLSEHTVIRCMIEEIKTGRMHPDEMYNEADDTDDD